MSRQGAGRRVLVRAVKLAPGKATSIVNPSNDWMVIEVVQVSEGEPKDDGSHLVEVQE